MNIWQPCNTRKVPGLWSRRDIQCVWQVSWVLCVLRSSHNAAFSAQHLSKGLVPELSALQVFAPLARLLGLYSIKEELEELAFSYSMPEQYTPLRLHLDRLAKEQRPMVMQVRQQYQKKAVPTSL